MRNRGLDLLKWIAIVTMVIDHLRLIHFLSVYNNVLVTIGRLAFPIFCFVMAFNYLRISQQNNTYALNSYFINLFVFCIISELPYRMLVTEPNTVNIMPTLLMGLVFMVIAQSRSKNSNILIFVFLVILAFTDRWLMYGALGVMLPFSCLIALKKVDKDIWILLPVLFAVLCNFQDLYRQVNTAPFLIFLICLFSAMAIVLCFFVIKQNYRIAFPKVGSWAYWFYPVHLFIFSLFNVLV